MLKNEVISLYSDLNISEFTQQLQNTNLDFQTKQIKKNDIITTYIKNRNQICILKKGNADIIRYDKNGNKTIIETLKTNDIFGEVFFPIKTNSELFVIAKTNCEVIFFLYNDILKYSNTLDNIFLNLFLNRTIKQNIRIELLTKRSTKEKLLSYFSFLSIEYNKKDFTLPLSYTDLADYLCIDRSAMMREIQHLQKENIIIKNGYNIKLKK